MKNNFSGRHCCPQPPLSDLPENIDDVLNQGDRDLAQPPIKRPKKIRAGNKESYPPMHGGGSF